MKIVISEKTLRDIVKEALDGTSYVPDPEMTKVNNVVDKSAAVTDPGNPNFSPQNPAELDVAVKHMTQNLDDADIAKVFDTLKNTLAKPEDDKQMNNDQKETTPTKGTKPATKSATAEGIVRSQIRQILSEMQFDAYDMAVAGDDDDDKKKKKAIATVPVESDGASFEDLAKDMGLGVSGAKQFVDKALARYKFINQEYEENVGKHNGHTLDDMEITIMLAYKDYVELLSSDGDLSQEEISLLEDHPEMVLELQGFREYLHQYIRRSMATDFEGPYQRANKFSADYDWIDDDTERSKVKKKAASTLTRSLSEPHMTDYVDKYAPEK
jgi:hypothetical protein